MPSSLSSADFMKQWSLLHGDSPTRGIVGAWLQISYRCALVLSKVKISPNSLTALGVLFGVATVLTSPSLLMGMFLALSLACDGIDGSLALVTGKVSKLGAVLDSIADRLTEALWAIAFYKLGVPLNVVMALWLLAGIQEYARARVGSAGIKELGVVTPAERPVRASFLFVGLIAWHIEFTHGWPTAIAEILVAMQFISLLMVIRFAYRVLK
ncbi:MAG: CDP-alcohol phosphatidyltransferase family protein [Actinobacteria bacterium]|nr:CDP-alcohol phosphatidyltransferase family protein [Actinomycetota bacterium]